MKERSMRLWCCECANHVEARLTDGREIYPHRPDLAALPFWRCDGCGGYVGTHHRSDDPTRPLGVIPSSAIRRARMHIHALIDPAWKTRQISRRALYGALSTRLGYEYHTAEIKSLDEARRVYHEAQSLLRDLGIETSTR